MLNLIYNVMTGGSCLQDVEARRRDPVYLDALGARKVPAPSTEGDFLRRFDRNSIWDLMEAVNEARRKVAARGRSTFSELRWYPPMEAAKGSLSWVFRAKQPESVRTGP